MSGGNGGVLAAIEHRGRRVNKLVVLLMKERFPRGCQSGLDVFAFDVADNIEHFFLLSRDLLLRQDLLLIEIGEEVLMRHCAEIDTRLEKNLAPERSLAFDRLPMQRNEGISSSRDS